MKSFVIAVCIFACAYANSDQEAVVVRSDYSQSPEGNFQYAYETDNGISGQANGVLTPFGKDEVALEVTGSNSYKSPEGEIITLTYTADKDGYHPEGAHLPTSPPAPALPEYIARAIEYIKAHPYSEPTKQ